MTRKTVSKARTDAADTALPLPRRRHKTAAAEKLEPTGETKIETKSPSTAKGTPQRLTSQLLDTLCADFEAHGADAIRACREEQPQGYLRLIAGLLPKDIHLNDNRLKDIADDELDLVTRILREHAARSQDGSERDQRTKPASR